MGDEVWVKRPCVAVDVTFGRELQNVVNRDLISQGNEECSIFSQEMFERYEAGRNH